MYIDHIICKVCPIICQAATDGRKRFSSFETQPQSKYILSAGKPKRTTRKTVKTKRPGECLLINMEVKGLHVSWI
jgi:hypothetical protein